MEETLFNGIALIGFPAVMCLWFMWRTESVMKNNNIALQTNSNMLSVVAEHLNECKNKKK